jgi:hypothetical protein
VTCAPKTVKAGVPFFVTVNFNAFYSRPVGVHVDLLNSNTKSYIAGDVVEVRRGSRTYHGHDYHMCASLVVSACSLGV